MRQVAAVDLRPAAQHARPPLGVHADEADVGNERVRRHPRLSLATAACTRSFAGAACPGTSLSVTNPSRVNTFMFTFTLI